MKGLAPIISREKEKKRKKFWNEFFKKFIRRSVDSSGLMENAECISVKKFSPSKSNIKKKKSNAVQSPANSSKNQQTYSITRRRSPIENKSKFGRTLIKNQKYFDDDNRSKTNSSRNLTAQNSHTTTNLQKGLSSKKTNQKNSNTSTLANVNQNENRLEYLFRQRYQSVVTHQVSSFKFWDHAVDKELLKLNQELSWAKIKHLVLQIAKKFQHEQSYSS